MQVIELGQRQDGVGEVPEPYALRFQILARVGQVVQGLRGRGLGAGVEAGAQWLPGCRHLGIELTLVDDTAVGAPLVGRVLVLDAARARWSELPLRRPLPPLPRHNQHWQTRLKPISAPILPTQNFHLPLWRPSFI